MEQKCLQREKLLHERNTKEEEERKRRLEEEEENKNEFLFLELNKRTGKGKGKGLTKKKDGGKTKDGKTTEKTALGVKRPKNGVVKR
jgi:hypothetical protein